MIVLVIDGRGLIYYNSTITFLRFTCKKNHRYCYTFVLTFEFLEGNYTIQPSDNTNRVVKCDAV